MTPRARAFAVLRLLRREHLLEQRVVLQRRLDAPRLRRDERSDLALLGRPHALEHDLHQLADVLSELTHVCRYGAECDVGSGDPDGSVDLEVELDRGLVVRELLRDVGELPLPLQRREELDWEGRAHWHEEQDRPGPGLQHVPAVCRFW